MDVPENLNFSLSNVFNQSVPRSHASDSLLVFALYVVLLKGRFTQITMVSCNYPCSCAGFCFGDFLPRI